MKSRPAPMDSACTPIAAAAGRLPAAVRFFLLCRYDTMALKSLGPELMARLSGGMVCRLESAEYPTRLGIVRQHARALELSVPEDVEAYIASHFTTQSRELAGALKKLQAASRAHERPISLALALWLGRE